MAATWYFLACEQQGGWKALVESDSALLERAFRAAKDEVIVGGGLLVSLCTMSAKDVAVKRVSRAGRTEWAWEFEERPSMWRPYSLAASLQVEEALRFGYASTGVSRGRTRYLVDFRHMIQRNLSTHFERPIRRVPLEKVPGEEEPLEIPRREATTLTCSICVDGFDDDDDKRAFAFEKCGPLTHAFHKDCVLTWLDTGAGRCPVCRVSLGPTIGRQPLDGNMTDSIINAPLPGFPHTKTRRITYDFPDGIQGPKHPKPGRPYSGTKRQAFLPVTPRGDHAFRLLKIAFRRRLVFRVGQSISTGKDDCVIWDGIHHKTSNLPGAPFGYPDPNYLSSLLDELKANGVEEDN